jgi:hypothetical protein
MKDIVIYKPFGLPVSIAHSLFIQNKLTGVFYYRAKATGNIVPL